MRMRIPSAIAAAIILPVLACAGAVAVRTTPAAAPVLVGAGDIASCLSSGDEETAALLDSIAGTVIALGDIVYPTGTAAEFRNCYAPSWGRHKARTRPSAGNHEYVPRYTTGYFAYFGKAAGDPSKGYYSYDLGAWHIIVLNSNSDCTTISCAAGSTQEQWLRADLAASRKRCTLAYWHHPRFNSGTVHGNDTAVSPFWNALYEANADVVVNGHEHVYERFAPQTPDAVADTARGIRQFTVGTGGRSHYSFLTIQPNSEVREENTFGVLKLTLREKSYDWQFVPVAGASFTDSGTGTCH
jgi:acid phosphatase type 7